jgi:hypothetical protein
MANKAQIRKDDLIHVTVKHPEGIRPDAQVFFAGKVKTVIRRKGAEVFIELETPTGAISENQALENAVSALEESWT